MHLSPSPKVRALLRIASFAGTLCALILAARGLCLFHAGRLIVHALVAGTAFLMLAYCWGMLLGKLWAWSGRISGCERKSVPSSFVARRRLRTTPFVRANRRACGYNA